MSGRFTGRHLAAILVGGFGLVIAVNLVMAVMATRTFPGLIVENSYVASQEFNKGLEAGRAQKKLGWTVAPLMDGNRLIVDIRNANGEPLHGASVEATIIHPVGGVAPQTVVLTEGADGRWHGRHALTAGQWELELTVSRDGKDYWQHDRLTVD